MLCFHYLAIVWWIVLVTVQKIYSILESSRTACASWMNAISRGQQQTKLCLEEKMKTQHSDHSSSYLHIGMKYFLKIGWDNQPVKNSLIYRMTYQCFPSFSSLKANNCLLMILNMIWFFSHACSFNLSSRHQRQAWTFSDIIYLWFCYIFVCCLFAWQFCFAAKHSIILKCTFFTDNILVFFFLWIRSCCRRRQRWHRMCRRRGKTTIERFWK